VCQVRVCAKFVFVPSDSHRAVRRSSTFADTLAQHTVPRNRRARHGVLYKFVQKTQSQNTICSVSQRNVSFATNRFLGNSFGPPSGVRAAKFVHAFWQRLSSLRVALPVLLQTVVTCQGSSCHLSGVQL